MRSTTLLFAAGTLAATLAACGHHVDTGIHLHSGALTVANGQVVIEGQDGSQARISSTGQLTIGGQDIVVSDPQRAQLVAYFNAASGVKRHAVATGVAGAQVGVTAASEVVSGLAKGDMSGLKAKVESQAGEVKRQALKLCDDFTAVRAAQDALTAELAAFKPYAVVSERDTADCAKDLHTASTQ
jgi:hypothetical protein